MIIISKTIVRIITCNFASAIALYPFILLSDKAQLMDENTINHEKIHLRQQIELLIVGFYLLYAMEYLYGRWNGKSHYQAYRRISFEKEAYSNEKNHNYIQQKKYLSFRQYWSASL